MAIDDDKVVTFKTLLEKYSYLIKSNVSTSNFSTNLKGITKQELLNNTDTNLYFLNNMPDNKLITNKNIISNNIFVYIPSFYIELQNSNYIVNEKTIFFKGFKFYLDKSDSEILTIMSNENCDLTDKTVPVYFYIFCSSQMYDNMYIAIQNKKDYYTTNNSTVFTYNGYQLSTIYDYISTTNTANFMYSESESVYNTDKNVAEVSKLTNSIKSEIQDSNITPNIIGYKYIPPNRNNQTEIIDENFIGTIDKPLKSVFLGNNVVPGYTYKEYRCLTNYKNITIVFYYNDQLLRYTSIIKNFDNSKLLKTSNKVVATIKGSIRSNIGPN